MLKKAKDIFNGTEPGSRGSIADDTTTASPDPVLREGRTVIGEQVSIEGNIRGKEDLVFHGSMKGNIELEKNHFTLGPKGRVEAEIQADNVTISGHMVGNIKATGKVEITQGADFNGEIKARGISVQDGAYLKAVIELDRESPIKSISAAKSVLPAASDADKEPAALAVDAPTKGRHPSPQPLSSP